MPLLFPPLTWKSYLFLLGALLGVSSIFIVQLLRITDADAFDLSLFHAPGEAILLELPGGYRVLVDTGETPEAVGKLTKELPFWERSIDAVVLTHGDRDHIGGMPALLSSFTVGGIFLPGTAQDAPLPDSILRMAQERSIPLVFLNKDVDFRVGGVVFDTLSPLQAVMGKNVRQQNTTSAAIRLSAGKQAILFTGDIEAKAEKSLLTSSAKLSADILKVPHHGSKTSSSPAFVAAVRAQTALVSAHKDNPFGHPDQEVADRYKNAQAEFLVTREIGDIHLPVITSNKNLFSF